MSLKMTAVALATFALSTLAQAQTYTKVSGANVDFYYDASSLGSDQWFERSSVNGDTLVLSSTAVSRLSDPIAFGTFIVVAHSGYLLNNYVEGIASSNMAYTISPDRNALDANYSVTTQTSVNSGTFKNGAFQNGQVGVASSLQSSYAENHKSWDGSSGPRSVAVGTDAPADLRFQSSQNYFRNLEPGYFDHALIVDANALLSGSSVLTSPLNVSFSIHGVMASAVPEPATYGMMMGGLGLVGFMVRRRKKADF